MRSKTTTSRSAPSTRSRSASARCSPTSIPATNNGSLSVAAAIVVYLSFRRDELNVAPDRLLQLAARAEWKGDPPEAVAELADHGIDLLSAALRGLDR